VVRGRRGSGRVVRPLGVDLVHVFFSLCETQIYLQPPIEAWKPSGYLHYRTNY
jgi:hypothetical protein